MQMKVIILLFLLVPSCISFLGRQLKACNKKTTLKLTKFPSIFEYSVKSLTDDDVPLLNYFGKKAYVIVNIGSTNPLTEIHLTELQSLYDTHKTQGLEIFGFPSDDFYNEPKDSGQIQEFLKQMKVTFPVFNKVRCNHGLLTHPLFKYLGRSFPNGIWGPNLRNDYEKFLCNAGGEVIHRYCKNTSPLGMEKRIKLLLDRK